MAERDICGTVLLIESLVSTAQFIVGAVVSIAYSLVSGSIMRVFADYAASAQAVFVLLFSTPAVLAGLGGALSRLAVFASGTLVGLLVLYLYYHGLNMRVIVLVAPLLVIYGTSIVFSSGVAAAFRKCGFEKLSALNITGIGLLLALAATMLISIALST